MRAGRPRRGNSPGCNALVVLAVLIAATGCGDGLNLVDVSGTVTLDGQPLPQARIVFRPRQGRPSAGIADGNGHYTLRYTDEKPGALPGEHAVFITTLSDDGKDSVGSAKEIVPPRYNTKSTLKVTVDPSNRTHDFALETK